MSIKEKPGCRHHPINPRMCLTHPGSPFILCDRGVVDLMLAVDKEARKKAQELPQTLKGIDPDYTTGMDVAEYVKKRWAGAEQKVLYPHCETCQQPIYVDDPLFEGLAGGPMHQNCPPR